MPETTCKNCRHFRQHYILFDTSRYNPIPCGHCVYPRLKHRKPGTPACMHFMEKEKERT